MTEAEFPLWMAIAVRGAVADMRLNLGHPSIYELSFPAPSETEVIVPQLRQ